MRYERDKRQAQGWRRKEQEEKKEERNGRHGRLLFSLTYSSLIT